MSTYGQFCGLARAMDRVGERWTLLIVRELLLGRRRFTDLRRGLPGIATNLLTDRLRQLEEDGLVCREELSPDSPRMVYALTEVGESLRPVIEELIRWGGRWMVAGAGDDVFRSEWLALALQALGAGEALECERIVRFETEFGPTTLSLGGGRVRLSPGTDPELVVRGDPAVVLGMAAGAVSEAVAAEVLELDPAGESSFRVLSRALTPVGGPGPDVVLAGPIRWRLNLPAPREEVYEALSTDAGRSRYWAETSTLADGRIHFVFPTGAETHGRVVENAPPRVFAVEYFGGVARFHLIADGRGGTDLELTHTGQRGREWLQTHAGWLNVLFPLKASVAHGVELRTCDPRRSWDDGYVDG